MRNPIFGHGKTPKLQINTLESILVSGQLSKMKVTYLLGANYPDVSDAMDALLVKKLIKLSDKYRTTGRNPEKFYKITEKGLRALLSITLPPDEFWKATVLLCMVSKKPITQEEFENYYRKFERNFLGHFGIRGYFFLIPLFDTILAQWLQAHNDPRSISLSQQVIECLAFNGPSIMQKLVEETSAKKEDLIKILNNYSIQSNTRQNSSPYMYTTAAAQSEMNVDRKQLYYDFVLHTLIVNKETTAGISYELSLFGVMLAIAVISYHFSGEDTYNNDVRDKLKLFYNRIDQKKYCDTIARNYKDKVPLIFGKWDFLKSKLGSMLYESFDFLIYMNSRSNSMNTSLWSFGNKEFYDDIRALTYNAIRTRLPNLYALGTITLRRYEEYQPWIRNDPRVIAVYNKCREIGVLLKYAEVVFALQQINNGNYMQDKLEARDLHTINDIQYIEAIFRDELCFLFYLDLNTIFFPSSYKKNSPRSRIEHGEHTIRLIVPRELEEETQEFFRLGSRKARLLAILSKDKDIKQWFSGWIDDIIEYRRQTFDKMFKFYNEIINSHENITKQPVFNAEDKKEKSALRLSYEEYNMAKICSDIDYVYAYSNSTNQQ
jgi:DNA-binding PadR family transcriptional regulator